MFKFVAATVLTCCGFACSVGDACDCGHCNCGCPCGAAPAAVVPSTVEASTPGTPGIATSLAPPATAGQSYRTYSYLPLPAASYRTSGNRSSVAGFHDAGWKIRGGN
jgi:hypothetical protein